MPRVKIDYIVSFSSEDPEHPADNLLAGEVGNKKWLCAKGEPSCSVVLQLARAVVISSVNVGAHHAALVEVLVGRSEKPGEPFQVLVPSSVMLSPAESRSGVGASRVRSFTWERLAADARTQRWDRVRLVCSQPYNKHCQYGLSFIHIFEPENKESVVNAEPTVSAAPTLTPHGSFTLDHLSSDDDEEFRPGELFAQHSQTSVDSQPSDPHTQTQTRANTDAQIRQVTSQALKNSLDSSTTKVVKSPIVKTSGGQASKGDREQNKRDRDSLLYIDDDDKPHKKIDSVVERHKESVKGRDRDVCVKTNARRHDTNVTSNDKQKINDKIKVNTKIRGDKINNETFSDITYKRDDAVDNRNKRDRDTHGDRDERYDAVDNRNKRDDAVYNRNKRDRDTHGDRDERYDAVDNRNKRDDAVYNRNKRDDAVDNRNKRDDAVDNKNKRDSLQNDKRKGDRDGRYERTQERGEGGGRARKRERDKHDRRDKVSEPRAGPVQSSPHGLLEGVVFALSGYENPRRAAVRDAAVAMGARFERDCTPRVTHLICAFPKTPKLLSLRGAGSDCAAATADWVEQCWARRQRLPWEWFATEPDRRLEATELTRPSSDDIITQTSSLDLDTDDEIEEVIRKQKRRRTAAEPEGSRGSDEDTEEESGAPAEQIDESRALPDLFEGASFVLEPDVSRADLLHRYIVAYGGLVLERSEMHEDVSVDYVVGGGRGSVPPSWVWSCHAARRLLPVPH